MHIKAPLCTGTNAGHEISCFVVIIKHPIRRQNTTWSAPQKSKRIRRYRGKHALLRVRRVETALITQINALPCAHRKRPVHVHLGILPKQEPLRVEQIQIRICNLRLN